MTDRIHSLTVVLESDRRDDDVKAIVNSILMIKGVLNVAEHVTDHAAHMAQERSKRELGDKLMAVIYPDWGINPGRSLK